MSRLGNLTSSMRACTVCEEQGLIPEARPVFQIGSGAKVGIFGQAPGNLTHQTRKPFNDPSGVRLRDWLGVSEEAFYNPSKITIVPMAFCFPGYDGNGPTGKGGDLPPPPICAQTWRDSLMAELLPQLELVFLIGNHAQRWHLVSKMERTLTDTVRKWPELVRDAEKKGNTVMIPLPHPSWRNNGWLKKNPWFETELLPEIRVRIRKLIDT
ncbi:uracil-DNA glycosylase family protein [Parvularcula sp. IMCC14364]|uniref:uracil-DNA glycosylase family protein n=1 Tax=Parvularcula sp. IMCC14364 TaxID=3067902 RepID=UPI002740435B|nr:uracil-DNA glycosylase family protein [Parvularcula sp. IMCC14364]